MFSCLVSCWAQQQVKITTPLKKNTITSYNDFAPRIYQLVAAMMVIYGGSCSGDPFRINIPFASLNIAVAIGCSTRVFLAFVRSGF